MSLFDFFFPEQAQASHLRSIASGQRRSSRRSSNQDRRLSDMEQDIGYLALILGSILHKLDEKGHVTRDEVQETLKELDELDGVKDGKLDINVLRGLNG